MVNNTNTPTLPTPRRPDHWSGRGLASGLAGTCASLALALLACTAIACAAAPKPYSPHPDRNAEYTGLTNGLDAATIDLIAQNDNFVVVNKSDRRGSLNAQIADINALHRAAEKYHNQLKVFAYYPNIVWLNNQTTGLAPFINGHAANFDPTNRGSSSWLMHDANGDPIPFYAQADPQHLRPPVGYIVDVANPSYQDWLVNRLLPGWMKSAPFSGMSFDVTDLLNGPVMAGRKIGNGVSSWNDILCGPGAPVDSSGNCDRVNTENDALRHLVQRETDKLHSLSGPYGPMASTINGIAPSQVRVNRNLDMFSYADGQDNESFCYSTPITGSGPLNFHPLSEDFDIMKTYAAEGKHVVQITNHQTESNLDETGAYCAAAFMIGWQPGSSFYVNHFDYSTAATANEYPLVREQNLNLGSPRHSTYQASGSVYTRRFANGFVVVNDSVTPASADLPSDLIEFRDGRRLAEYSAGATISLAPRSGRFFLDRAYLAGVAADGTKLKSSASTIIAAKPTITGNASANARVKVTIHSDPIVCETRAAADGTWSCEIAKRIPAGCHTLTVVITSSDGTTTTTQGPYSVCVPGGPGGAPGVPNTGFGSPALANPLVPLAVGGLSALTAVVLPRKWRHVSRGGR